MLLWEQGPAANWSVATQVLEGRVGWEAYALVPFRLPGWRPGMYMGLAAFFNTTGGPAAECVPRPLSSVCRDPRQDFFDAN